MALIKNNSKQCIILFLSLLLIIALMVGCGLFKKEEVVEEGTYSASGRIKDNSGKGLQGITLRFADGFGSATTDSKGRWSKTGLQGTVAIKPVDNEYIFTPKAIEVSGEDSDIIFLGNSIHEEVIFEDAILESVIRDVIEKSEGPIYIKDVMDITRLDATDLGITSIAGLQYMRSLEFLYLGQNQLTDISPLEYLTELRDLYLYENHVGDMSVLQKHTYMRDLILSNNLIEDIGAIGDMTELRFLHISYNRVTDLSPVENLKNLRAFTLNNNKVANLSPVQGLSNLRTLWFCSNQVEEITVLADLTGLKSLTFTANMVSEVDALENLTGLELLRIQNNQISDIGALANLINLEVLSFGNCQGVGLNNQVADISPLRDLINLDTLVFDGNEVTDISPLIDNGEFAPDSINMAHNKLDLTVGSQALGVISELQGRGVEVTYKPQKYTVSGKVVDDESTEIAGVNLVFSYPAENTSVNTGPDGKWVKEGLRGWITVTPQKDGYDFVPQNVVVGESAQNLNFTGTRNTYSVSGIVLDENSQALGGVEISFSGEYEPVTTAGDGSWSKDDLAGVVIISAAKDGYVFDPLDVRVTGERQDVSFQGTSFTSVLFGNLSIEHNWPVSVVEEEYIPDTGAKIEKNSQVIQDQEYVPGQIIVGFQHFSTQETKNNIFHDLQSEIIDHIKPLNAYLLEVQSGVEEVSIDRAMAAHSVAYAEPNYLFQALTTIPDDHLYTAQWHYPQIRLPQAWSITTGDLDIRIAVLDTGINAGHPDLAPRVDVDAGYNFIDENIEENTDANDIHGHGTHVAGTIGALTDNSIGIAGTMWNSSLIPVKVLNDYGSGTSWSVAQGILYAAGLLGDPAISEPAHIINMSLGGGYCETQENAVQAAHNAGVIMVAASGNSNCSLLYPAGYPEVIAVGAVGYNGSLTPARASYSNFGPELDLVAPGGDLSFGILSTDVNSSGGHIYGYRAGTSMAAPHVAGVLGLMLAAGINPDEARDILCRTSMDLGEPGFDPYYGYGLVNAYWAVNEVEGIRILVGERQGETVAAVAEGQVCLQAKGFNLADIPAGEYKVYAWIDIQGDGIIAPGDYFAASDPIVFAGDGEYYLDLILREVK